MDSLSHKNGLWSRILFIHLPLCSHKVSGWSKFGVLQKLFWQNHYDLKARQTVMSSTPSSVSQELSHLIELLGNVSDKKYKMHGIGSDT